MKRNRIIIIVIIAALAVGGFFAFRYTQARAQSSNQNSPQTATVTRGTITTSVLATGYVRPNQSATLAWQTVGTVDKVNVKVGDQVTATQVLASLAQDSLSQSVILAQADLTDAKKALDDLLNSQVPMVQAKQAVENAQKALNDYDYNFPVVQAQAQAALTAAQDTLTTATKKRNSLDIPRASQQQIDVARASYFLAQDKVNQMQDAYDHTGGDPQTDAPKALALGNLAAAQQQRDRALASLNWYLGKPGAQDIADADAALAQAKAALAQAQYNWDRVKDGPNSTDRAMLQAQLADAQRAYDRVKNGPDPSDVAAAQAHVSAAQATVDQTMIKAPFNGIITDMSVLPGDQATSGKVVFRLDDYSHLYVDVNISEVDIPNVQVGQAVNMTFDAIPGKTYNGKVTLVSMAGTVTQGVVQFGVTVEITNADANVRSGLTASLSIITQRKTNVLLVPNRAVHVQGSQRYVTVLFEGNQIQVPVTIGLTNDTNSEVTEGSLKEGDEVVISTQAAPARTNTGGGFFGGFGR